MKKLFTLLFIPIIFLLTTQKNEAACCAIDGGRCTGSAYCTACTNCSGCKHCAKNGGSCGVCSSGKTYRSNKRYKTYNKKSYGTTPSAKSKKNYKASQSKLYVTAKTLNVRKGPGTAYKIIEKIKYGDTVTYLSTTGNWVKIKVINSGTIGYVHYKYVQ